MIGSGRFDEHYTAGSLEKSFLISLILLEVPVVRPILVIVKFLKKDNLLQRISFKFIFKIKKPDQIK